MIVKEKTLAWKSLQSAGCPIDIVLKTVSSTEVSIFCREVLPGLRVLRAKFSEITRPSIDRAMATLGQVSVSHSDSQHPMKTQLLGTIQTCHNGDKYDELGRHCFLLL